VGLMARLRAALCLQHRNKTPHALLEPQVRFPSRHSVSKPRLRALPARAAIIRARNFAWRPPLGYAAHGSLSNLVAL